MLIPQRPGWRKVPVYPVALLLIIIGLLSACNSPAPEPTATPPPTPTSLPHPTLVPLPTISPEQAAPFREIQAMAEACQALHPNRRQTVIQHMEWLINVDDIPQQFLQLYGHNVQGKLAFGAVYMVAVQWKLDGRPEDSCLIPIGTRLNSMTNALGEQPVPEFDLGGP